MENHPYLQQPLLKKYCNSKGIVLEAYSPLGNPARPFVVAEDPVVMEDPAIKELAAKHSVSAAQVSTKFTGELHSAMRFCFQTVLRICAKVFSGHFCGMFFEGF